jgi:hypothetical protein
MDPGIITIGWREWATLPDLGINRIKAKIDTGARTSAIHAFDMRTFTENGVERIWFALHPFQRRTDIVKECVADIHDQRWVSDSGGHREERYVILTTIAMGDMEWPVEITLTNRDNMKFRMLLGRTAMKNRFRIDPSASYVLGKYKHKDRGAGEKQP